MKKPALLFIPFMLALAGCGSGGNPLSTLGIMPQQKEAIDYSPRPPLAIPPEDQRAQLPPPQDGVPQPLSAQPVQETAIAPPASYAAPTPPPQGMPPAVEEDTPWWTRIFGS